MDWALGREFEAFTAVLHFGKASEEDSMTWTRDGINADMKGKLGWTRAVRKK